MNNQVILLPFFSDGNRIFAQCPSRKMVMPEFEPKSDSSIAHTYNHPAERPPAASILPPVPSSKKQREGKDLKTRSSQGIETKEEEGGSRSIPLLGMDKSF